MAVRDGGSALYTGRYTLTDSDQMNGWEREKDGNGALGDAAMAVSE